VLLNRGQETFSITDANGNLTTETRFGYGTFWPTNAMHDTIAFPEVPKEPTKPVKPNSLDIELNNKYNVNLKQYNIDLEIYNRDKINYNVSTQIKFNPTFHHLYVVFNKDNKIDLERLKKYLYAGQSEQGKVLKEYYLLEKKTENDTKTNK
jgi:hypothetical protein